jgi:cell division transport system permease protein
MSNGSEYILNHFNSTIKSHWRLHLTTILTLAASFIVISSLMVLGKNLNHLLTLWGEDLQLSVYLTEGATQANRNQIYNILNRDENIKRIDWLTKEKALNQFQEQMSSYAPDLLKDPDLVKFIPESYQVSLNETLMGKDQISVFKNLKTKLTGIEGVEDVSYGQDWIQSYSQFLQTANLTGFTFIVLVLVLTMFVMSNFIQRSVHQRRAEIEVLELIGATSSFIRIPYLIEGAVTGLFSAAIGVGFCGVLFLSLKQSLASHLTFFRIYDQINYLSVLQIILLLILSSGLGVLASYISVKSINSGWAAAARASK